MNVKRKKAMKNSRPFASLGLLLSFIALFTFSTSHAQDSTPDVIAPPSFGEQTKGKPAIAETSKPESNNESGDTSTQNNDTVTVNSFGSTTVTEHKRESGQVYLIELDNSLGGKQYLHENDSDGQIGSSIEDNESIKEIPKWKLGSW